MPSARLWRGFLLSHGNAALTSTSSTSAAERWRLSSATLSRLRPRLRLPQFRRHPNPRRNRRLAAVPAVDKRLKAVDSTADAALRDTLYSELHAGKLSMSAAVKTMRRISHLTQPEFAAHRGISVQALKQIEYGTGNPTVETLNKVASIFGLEVGFVPKRSRPRLVD